MEKVLIIQTAFIGDVVLATALIEKLHHHNPALQIDFMVRKGNEALLHQHPLLREVLVWNKKQDKYRNLFALLKKVRSNRYDLIINVQRFAATGFLTAFSGARETIGFDKNPLSRLFSRRIKHVISTIRHPLHEIDRNQLLIKHLTGGEAARPRLYPTEDDYKAIAQYQRQSYVCVAPASVWFTKQYPPEKWASFIGKLPGDVKVYLLGAPDDNQLCERIIELSGSINCVNLSGKLNFLQSVALQQSAVMSYVNDSAPMHFASAVNGPVAAVYCSTVPAFGFGPLSDKSYVVETRLELECKPCGLHGHKSCPLGHFKCAYTIEDEQLLNLIPTLS